jgi:hypothetical protein
MSGLIRPELAYSLLKWLNSLYRPALPEESARAQSRRFPDRLLGRRQVVRQWILIPPCGGSNPPAPARQSVNRRLYSRTSQKGPPIAGFCRLVRRL